MAYLNVRNTVSAGAWSAMIHNTSRNAKKPKTWTNRMMPSARGNWCAQKILKPTVRITTAKTSRVVCQSPPRFASGFVIQIIPSRIPASCKAHDGIPAIHPRQQYHPTTYDNAF